MNSQIYLFLVRNSSGGAIDPPESMLSVAGFQKLMASLVLGDSMDLPFVKFIRVSDINHGISFGGTTTIRKYDKESLDAKNAEIKTENTAIHAENLKNLLARPSRFAGITPGSDEHIEAMKPLTINPDKALKTKADSDAWIERTIGSDSQRTDSYKNNDFASIDKPDHGDLTFSKWLDCATPQLAHGCCSQDVFPLAIFFFRRRIGVGVSGIRAPYLVLGLYKCRISSYNMSGDSETVSLKYNNIAWSSVDTFGDSPVPAGLSQRYWDVGGQEGGQLGWPSLLALIAQALVGAVGAPFLAQSEESS